MSTKMDDDGHQLQRTTTDVHCDRRQKTSTAMDSDKRRLWRMAKWTSIMTDGDRRRLRRMTIDVECDEH